MIIKLRGLAEGGHTLENTESPGLLGLDKERFGCPVLLQIVIDKRRINYYLKIIVETSSDLECDRCLEKFSKQIKSTFSLIYTEDTEFENLDSNEEMRYFPKNTDEISVDDDIRQNIVLEIPMKILCKEDCAGVCPKCGLNKNKEQCTCSGKQIDPRWEKLKQIDFE